MEIKLKRYKFTEYSSIGDLYIDGKYFCKTLEPKDRKLELTPSNKIYGAAAIPRGRYRVILNYSSRFGKIMPLLLNVPGFDGCRIHVGNYAGNPIYTSANGQPKDDTSGCILVGLSVAGEDMISQSNSAYEKLMKILRDSKEEVWITID